MSVALMELLYFSIAQTVSLGLQVDICMPRF